MILHASDVPFSHGDSRLLNNTVEDDLIIPAAAALAAHITPRPRILIF
jgi:hypothetical protein